MIEFFEKFGFFLDSLRDFCILILIWLTIRLFLIKISLLLLELLPFLSETELSSRSAIWLLSWILEDLMFSTILFTLARLECLTTPKSCLYINLSFARDFLPSGEIINLFYWSSHWSTMSFISSRLKFMLYFMHLSGNWLIPSSKSTKSISSESSSSLNN